jgi:hypothetical protein
LGRLTGPSEAADAVYDSRQLPAHKYWAARVAEPSLRLIR